EHISRCEIGCVGNSRITSEEQQPPIGQIQQKARAHGAKLVRLVRVSTRVSTASRQKYSSSSGSADDFEHLRADLIKEHDPQSVSESELVERLAVILWRLRRVPSFEVAILDARQQQVWDRYGRLSEEEKVIWRIGNRSYRRALWRHPRKD